MSFNKDQSYPKHRQASCSDFGFFLYMRRKPFVRSGILSQGAMCCDSHFKSIALISRLKEGRRRHEENYWEVLAVIKWKLVGLRPQISRHVRNNQILCVL